MLLYTGYIEGYIFSLGNDTNTNYMAMEVKDSTKLSIDKLQRSVLLLLHGKKKTTPLMVKYLRSAVGPYNTFKEVKRYREN
jgi:hypothetical protein